MNRIPKDKSPVRMAISAPQETEIDQNKGIHKENPFMLKIIPGKIACLRPLDPELDWLGDLSWNHFRENTH